MRKLEIREPSTFFIPSLPRLAYTVAYRSCLDPMSSTTFYKVSLPPTPGIPPPFERKYDLRPKLVSPSISPQIFIDQLRRWRMQGKFSPQMLVIYSLFCQLTSLRTFRKTSSLVSVDAGGWGWVGCGRGLD